LPDGEPVTVGHYNSPHVPMTAAEAVALMMRAEQREPAEARRRDAASGGVHDSPLPSSPEGYEVIVPRRVRVSELLRFRALPQVVGWRYQPGAHGTAPCTCLCCGGKGQYGVRKLLAAVEEAEATGKPTKVAVFGRGDDSYRRVERLRRRRRPSR
jgi:hypothetical protein